jgi:hypothetical protein
MTLPVDYYIKNIPPPPPLKKRRPVIMPVENPAKATAGPEKMPPGEYYISQVPVPPPTSTIEIPPVPPVENPAKATASPGKMPPGEYYISQVPVAPPPPEKLDDTVRDMIDEMMALPDAGEEALITSEEAAERGIVMPEGYKVRGYGENGVTMFSIIDDLGYEYRLDGTVRGPDGEEIEYGEEEEPGLTEIKDDLQALFPGSSEESISYLIENLENTWFQDVVIRQIKKTGRDEITESLLRAMGADEAGIDEFFRLLEAPEPELEISKTEQDISTVSDTVTAGMTVPYLNIDELEGAKKESARDEIIAAILATVDFKTASPDAIKELLGPISTAGFVEIYYLQNGWQHPDRKNLKLSEEQAVLTLDAQRLNESSDKYIEIYGMGEFLKSGGIEALSQIAHPAQLLKPEVTLQDFNKWDWILTGIDAAFIIAPALKGLTSAGLKTIYQSALNAGLDRWIAQQGRMVPESFIRKWLSENPAVVEQATNNFLKRLAEKKGVQYAAEKAADDTIKDIAPKLLGEYKGTGLEKPAPIKLSLTDPETFIKARDQSKRIQFLTHYTTEQLKDVQLFLSEDSKIGYALTKDNDLINVFNNSDVKGAAQEAVIQAIVNGAETLDCYDGPLVAYYKRFGFREYKRDAWNDEYAPVDWNYKQYEKPDTVYMRYEGGTRDAEEIRRRFRTSGPRTSSGR